jgi:hypothetical protein
LNRDVPDVVQPSVHELVGEQLPGVEIPAEQRLQREVAHNVFADRHTVVAEQPQEEMLHQEDGDVEQDEGAQRWCVAQKSSPVQCHCMRAC